MRVRMPSYPLCAGNFNSQWTAPVIDIHSPCEFADIPHEWLLGFIATLRPSNATARVKPFRVGGSSAGLARHNLLHECH